ncbi:MAG TPA: ferrochelatase [Planctomycetota bacterium]|nr:ferrochelatase [Planctomycetota bacterium]OQC20971.1 MAG: Ferrochelatase [Planctomycetes bacterium ADurb.Bin069]NMD36278.1 ferrochelatase [Planctomycetota bacterium]HNR98467.1 ferrochelatase [Planctomycetota bacterium]HNU25113.1 ferrochelatase [Planctomycetota bacterium]
MSRFAVCLLGMGAPAGPKAVRGYLYRIFSDRCILPLPAVLRIPAACYIAVTRSRASKAKYSVIGGQSPFTAQSRAQCQALAAALDRRGRPMPVIPAMRYASPSIGEAVRAMRDEGVTDVVGLSQYPQYSFTTTASCLEALERACARAGMRVVPVPEYPVLPGLVAAWAEALKAYLPAESPENRNHVLFLAHSVPMSCVERGDPYPEHVARTVNAILGALPRPVEWSLAYQSRAARGAWLSPSAESAVLDLARRGTWRLAVVPVSFVTENLETRYDIDANLALLAANAGLRRFARVPVPHAAPALIEGWADLVEEALRGAQ